jgi:hypothetical protein
MTQVAVDDNLAEEVLRLSGLPLEEAANYAFKGYLGQLQLREMRGRLTKDDWFDGYLEEHGLETDQGAL